MRFILPAIGAALALSIGTSAASAQHHREDHRHHQAPVRVKSHVALHLSGHSALTGEGVTVRGKVRPSGGHRVEVLFSGPDQERLAVHTRSDGTFEVRWEAGDIGDYEVTAHAVHERRMRGSGSPARQLTSFREAEASYYGGILIGHGVACGGTLRPGRLGVANKTLACGTLVTLRYHGRQVTVPVIDRGPYVAGREYDLTEATKEALGFPGVGTVLANH